MHICVDFDGTIVDHRYPDIGLPVPHAIEYMKKWQAAGAKLILFTMRDKAELEAAVTYLNNNGIKLYGVNWNPDQGWTSSPKAYAQIYVDDAALGCPLKTHPDFLRPFVDWAVVGPRVLYRIEQSTAE